MAKVIFPLALFAIPFNVETFRAELNSEDKFLSFYEQTGGQFAPFMLLGMKKGQPFATTPSSVVAAVQESEEIAQVFYRIGRAGSGNAGDSEPKVFMDGLPMLQSALPQLITVDAVKAWISNNPILKPPKVARAEKTRSLSAFHAFEVLLHRVGWAAMIEEATIIGTRIVRDYSTMKLEIPTKDGSSYAVEEPDAEFRRVVTESTTGEQVIAGLMEAFGSYLNQTPQSDYGIGGLKASPIKCTVGEVSAEVPWQTDKDNNPRTDLGISMALIYQPKRAPTTKQSEAALKAAGLLIESKGETPAETPADGSTLPAENVAGSDAPSTDA